MHNTSRTTTLFLRLAFLTYFSPLQSIPTYSLGILSSCRIPPLLSPSALFVLAYVMNSTREFSPLLDPLVITISYSTKWLKDGLRSFLGLLPWYCRYGNEAAFARFCSEIYSERARNRRIYSVNLVHETVEFCCPFHFSFFHFSNFPNFSSLFKIQNSRTFPFFFSENPFALWLKNLSDGNKQSAPVLNHKDVIKTVLPLSRNVESSVKYAFTSIGFLLKNCF